MGWRRDGFDSLRIEKRGVKVEVFKNNSKLFSFTTEKLGKSVRLKLHFFKSVGFGKIKLKQHRAPANSETPSFKRPRF
jgi:hypothetical protein